MADNTGIIELSTESIIFYHVAQLRGFRAAATHLGLSKSVVSSKVAGLEARVGRKLLFRSTRDVSLTPDGEIYFVHAQSLVEASKRLQANEGGFQREISGLFTISAPNDFAYLWLIPRLKALQALHPKLRVNFLSSDAISNLEKEKIDLAIRVDAGAAGHLYRSPFFEVRFGFFCRPDLVPARSTEKDLLDWVQAEGVFSFRPGREKSFTLGAKSFEVKVRREFQVHDVLSAKSLALAGAGISILPSFAIAPGELSEVLPAAKIRGVSYAFFSGARRQEDARLDAVIGFLSRAAKEDKLSE